MSDLLPANATDQERAISNTLDRPVPVIVREVWNPDTCPVALLPWLAWAFSVDTWDSAWTEAQKRGVIKASVAVHEKKGTIGALKAGLAGLGYDIDVTEWFQKSPIGDPYTFSLLVNLEDVGMPTETEYQQIVTAAEAAKNLRSHLVGVDTRLTASGTLYVGAAVWDGETTLIDSEPVTLVFNSTSLIG